MTPESSVSADKGEGFFKGRQLEILQNLASGSYVRDDGRCECNVSLDVLRVTSSQRAELLEMQKVFEAYFKRSGLLLLVFYASGNDLLKPGLLPTNLDQLRLTKRQEQVLIPTIAGSSKEDIAKGLGISVEAIETRLRLVLDKFSAGNLFQVAAMIGAGRGRLSPGVYKAVNEQLVVRGG